jgi:hypothetical protein
LILRPINDVYVSGQGAAVVAGGWRLTAGQICDCEGEREGEAVGGGGRAVAGLGPSPSERAGIGGRRPLLFPQVGFLWGGPCGVDTGLKSIPAHEDFFLGTLQPMKFKKVDLFPHQKSVNQIKGEKIIKWGKDMSCTYKIPQLENVYLSLQKFIHHSNHTIQHGQNITSREEQNRHSTNLHTGATFGTKENQGKP